jgi:uncharacterized protein (TIGR03084 family)
MVQGMTDAAVLADLRAEGDDVEALVHDLAPADWAQPTPAAGWTIAHQIAHLAWTDDVALLAVCDPTLFQAEVDRARDHIEGYLDRAAEEGARREGLLDRWHSRRTALASALQELADSVRVPWFGTTMSATSMATARLMETWAHGQDIADTLGVTRTPTTRLRNVAHLGVRTRDFAHLLNDRAVPSEEFFIDLEFAGEHWTWGPADATQRVTGPALDFCLLVTRRRHRDDLAVTAVGEQADTWLSFAQAYAGVPGAGPERRG